MGLGLFLIGVPYAVIWGSLAAALRFIPYVGAFVAALLPLALSLAVLPGWLQPALVVGLFLVLELTTGWVMEPWLYGQSAGVSPVALLIASAIPLTPGGLGIVETGVVGILRLAYGVPASAALAITLVDRTISVLSIIVLGSVAYVLSPLRRGAGLRGDYEVPPAASIP